MKVSQLFKCFDVKYKNLSMCRLNPSFLLNKIKNNSAAGTGVFVLEIIYQHFTLWCENDSYFLLTRLLIAHLERDALLDVDIPLESSLIKRNINGFKQSDIEPKLSLSAVFNIVQK